MPHSSTPLLFFPARHLKFSLRANNTRVVHPNSISISPTLVQKRPCVSTSIDDRARTYITLLEECNKCYIGQSGKDAVRLGL